MAIPDIDVCPYFCTRCTFGKSVASSLDVYRFVYVCRRSFVVCDRYAKFQAEDAKPDAEPRLREAASPAV